MARPTFASPPELIAPAGYSHVVTIPAGRLAWTAGQVPMTRDREVPEGWEAQARLAFDTGRALRAAGAAWSDVVKLTISVVELSEVATIAAFVTSSWTRRRLRPVPLEVAALFDPDVLLEVEAVAFLPDRRSPPGQGGLRARLVAARHELADESLLVGDRDRLGPAVHAELGEHALEVARDRLRADHELLAICLGRIPPASSSSTSRSRAVSSASIGARGDDAAAPARAGDQPSGAGKQLILIGGLDDVVVAANEQTCRAVERLRAVSGDEDDRKIVAELVPQLTCDLEAADIGEEDAEQHEARPHRRTDAMASSPFTASSSRSRHDRRDERRRPGSLRLVHDQDGAAVGHQSFRSALNALAPLSMIVSRRSTVV